MASIGGSLQSTYKRWISIAKRHVEERGVIGSLLDLFALLFSALCWGIMFFFATLMAIVTLCIGLIGGIIITMTGGLIETWARFKDWRRNRRRG